MVLTFCKKSEFYERFSREDSFIYPTDEEVIARYTIMEIIDRPIIGDLVKVRGHMYKVFHTMVDYDKKEVFAVVDDFSSEDGIRAYST